MLLKKFINYLLNPGYVLGIGVFFGNTNSKRKHRQIIIKSHPNLARWQSVVFYVFCLTLWYLVIFWIHLIIFSIKKHPPIHKSPQSNTLKTLQGILYCGLWIGVSPLNFYILNLAHTPREKWWNHIFIEESSTWHTQLNRNPSSEKAFASDVSTLANKKIFAEQLSKKNIPIIATLFHSPKGSHIENSKLSKLYQQHKAIFIKPINKNAMRGCFELHYAEEQKSIALEGNSLTGRYIETNDEQKVFAIIQQLNEKTDLLIQPLLRNHQELGSCIKNYNTAHLITLRIVSIYNHRNQNVQLIYATLELPSKTIHGVQWEANPIDKDTGEVKISENCQIPYWQELQSIIQLAHQEFKSIKTIAWDVCLSTEGIKIIEGNFGWNIIEQQNIHSSQALDYI